MRRPGARRTRRTKKLRRRRGLVGFLRDVAGNATTETVLMIPVFVVIWGGIFYTHDRYRAAIQMSKQTRADVWAHAFAGCDGSPPGDTRISTEVTSSDGFISGVVDLLVGSGILPGFQFDEIEGWRDARVERPAALGEGSTQMSHNLVVMCNERTQGRDGFGDTAWGMFF